MAYGQGEDKLYSLDIPQKEGIQGYIGTFFTLFLKLATILQTPEFSKEPIRLFYMIEFIIALIPEPENRKLIRSNMKKLKAQMEEDYKKETGKKVLDQAERDHILIVASIQSVGDVSDYIDEFMGISVKNKIGFVRKKDGTLETFDKTKHTGLQSEIHTKTLKEGL